MPQNHETVNFWFGEKSRRSVITRSIWDRPPRSVTSYHWELKLKHVGSSDEELEELMKDQLLPADASPIALSSGYISDSDPEEDDEEDQRRILLTILPTEETMMIMSHLMMTTMMMIASRSQYFHVSNLRKYYADEPLAVPLDELHFDDKLRFVEKPAEIMDREVKRGPHDTQYCMEDPEQAFVEYASSRTDEAGAHSNEANISQTSLLQTEIGIKPRQPEEPEQTLEYEFQDLHLNLPVPEVLAHAIIYNALLDKYMESLELGKNRLGDSKPFDTLADLGSCEEDSLQPPMQLQTVGWPRLQQKNESLDYHLPGEWEITRDVEINPFKDVLVFRRMVEFLGFLPINPKSNMWESEDLINNLINWNKPPKDGDGAWHAKIRLIDPDEEEFTKTLQSIPATRKLSERESPREIIDLDHFYDT
ncbi:hypothetical protein Tco_0656208 [Tanacetum coccineum]|uniref:Uncharacterized protein n=1 Tax=Tanacetum coccineum TaxID=301880 RepID=A0ABQ4X873_9ASTR